MIDLNIIIAGGGKVGGTLAEQLSAEGHNIIIIDQNQGILDKLNDQLDVMCVRGNCAARGTLIEAGAGDADIVIAATDADEVNLLCCHAAHRLGVPHTVARVRDTSYAGDLDALKEDLGITLLVNPELAAATEISRILRFPSASNVESFARGRVEMVSFQIQASDFLVDKALSDLSSRIQSLPILFCAVERDNKVTIPNGAFVLRQGDRVHMAGTPAGLLQFFRLLGRNFHKIKNVFIVGGGRIVYYLLVQLERIGMYCKVVEKDADQARLLAETFLKSLIIHGDGTDTELLTEERMSAADAFIALTDRDEDNLIISLYAHQAGVPKIIAKSSHKNFTPIAQSAGVESVVSPKITTAYQILRLIRGLQNSKGETMTALYRIAGGQAEAMEFRVRADNRHLGVPLRDLSRHLRPGVLIAVIVRDGTVIIPDGSTCLEVDDDVIVVAQNSVITDLDDIYADA